MNGFQICQLTQSDPRIESGRLFDTLLHMRFRSSLSTTQFVFIKKSMTTYCEESDRLFVRNELEGILDKYRNSIHEDLLLKDIMNFSILLYQTKKVQYVLETDFQ